MAKMEGVFANLNPVRIQGTRDFGAIFTENLANSKTVRMCTGYVAAESLVELLQLVQTFAEVQTFEIVVGMAKFDGLTRDQLSGLEKLHSYLMSENRGAVYLATAIPIHAKVSVFTGNTVRSIVGSSNLGSLTRATRQYEVDLLIEESLELTNQLEEFLEKAIQASESFSSIKDEIKIIVSEPHPLENLHGVKKVEPPLGLEFEPLKNFEIPVGTGEKSNLNTFFGKGRKSVNGRIVPRPWYEVELIVPKHITEMTGYPTKDISDGVFAVITDDGFEFECRTSGDYSKNLRSKADLETLGRWVKGRLERAGALEVGEMVTSETLDRYGRNSISLRKIKGSAKWFMDFGVKRV